MESEKLLLKDFVFISTLSDLGMHMLKLDVTPGEYGIKPLYEGYVWTTDDYSPDCKDIVKIFNTRSGDKGLSGTYWGIGVEDPNQMRLFNKWFRFHLHEDYIKFLIHIFPCDNISDNFIDEKSDSSDFSDDMSNCDEFFDKVPGCDDFSDDYMSDETWDGVTRDDYADKLSKKMDADLRKGLASVSGFKSLPDYHNLPVLFYLNRSLTQEDLKLVSMRCSCVLESGSIQRIWRVEHEQYGDIGVAVQQKKLFDMMGDQAGITFFATTSAQAFGNFNFDIIYYEEYRSEWASNPRYKYICKFNPCHCDTSHKPKN